MVPQVRFSIQGKVSIKISMDFLLRYYLLLVFHNRKMFFFSWGEPALRFSLVYRFGRTEYLVAGWGRVWNLCWSPGSSISGLISDNSTVISVIAVLPSGRIVLILTSQGLCYWSLRYTNEKALLLKNKTVNTLSLFKIKAQIKNLAKSLKTWVLESYCMYSAWFALCYLCRLFVKESNSLLYLKKNRSRFW